MSIIDLIEESGGNAAFSRALGIPLKTVEGWKSGKHCPDYNVDAYWYKLQALGLMKMNNKLDF